MFDNKQACIEYESALESKRPLIYLFENCVEFLDEVCESVTKNLNCDFSNETEYIRFKNISSEECEKLKYFLETHFGIDIMSDSNDDLYYYDEEECRFQSLFYKIEDLKERLDKYEEIKSKLELLEAKEK